MRVLIKTLFIFLFFLGFTSCINLNNSAFDSHSNTPISYIQKDYQKVVLTSQNFRNSEIFAEQTDNNNGHYLGKTSSVSSNLDNYNNFVNNNPNYHWGIIHRISTGINSGISIRAP